MPEYSSSEKKNYLYFKNHKDCENYLIKLAKNKFKYMQINSSGTGKYLKNSKNTQFVICKELNYKGISNLGSK